MSATRTLPKRQCPHAFCNLMTSLTPLEKMSARTFILNDPLGSSSVENIARNDAGQAPHTQYMYTDSLHALEDPSEKKQQPPDFP